MSKKWSLVLTLVLAASLVLSACSGNKNNNGGNTAATPTPTAQPSAEPTAANTEEKPPVEENTTEDAFGLIPASDPSKNPALATSRTDTAIIGMADPSGVFNPLFSEITYDAYVTRAVFDSLITLKADGTYENSLAEKVEISEDSLTYTYTLKKGVTYSDGTPVTSKDYLFVMKVYHDSSYDGGADIHTAKIVGGKEYYEGKATDISGIKIIDDYTFSVTVSEYNALTPIDLGFVFLIPEHYYGPAYKQGNVNGLKELNNKPLGSGPYILTDYKPGQEVVFKANENYFKGAPKIPNLIFKTTSSVTDIAMLSSGETDMNDNVTVDDDNIEALKALGFVDINVLPFNGYGYVGFNHNLPKFADKRVRQALTYGLNRADIVEGIYGKYGKVINIPQSSESWAYTEENINPYEFDMDKAKALLDEAGWVVGADGIREKDGEKFKINFSATANNSVIDALIPIMTLNYQELGIELVAETLEFNAIIAKREVGDFEMFFAAWGLTPDPDTSIFITDGAQNDLGYSNPRVDELMAAGLKELDIEKRKALYAEMYQHLNEDLPYIFLYQRASGIPINTRLGGFDISPYKYFAYSLHEASIAQ